MQGIVFGQVLFRVQDATDPALMMVAMQNANYLNKAVEFMIEMYKDLYPTNTPEEQALLNQIFVSPQYVWYANTLVPEAETEVLNRALVICNNQFV